MISGLERIHQQATYRAYLRRLDARAVLEHYGAQNCQEQINRKDGSIEIIHSCLLDRVEPHHSNGDQSPSASCNLDKKTYVCYSMGYGCDLFHLIEKLEGRDGSPLATMGKFLTGATQEGATFAAELDKIFTGSVILSSTLPAYDPSVLNGFDHPHPYWDQRGITEAARQSLRLGYDPREHRITFPVFYDGVLVGWQKRVVPGETYPSYPKYRNSFSFPKSTVLYNYDIARQFSQVVVVESPMSVARAVSLGLPNVTATFGAKVSKAQIALLYPFSTVYVWFDDEPYAGLIGEQRIVEGLYRHTEVRVVVPDKDRDMGDCDLAEISRKIDTAVPAALRLGYYDLVRSMSGKVER